LLLVFGAEKNIGLFERGAGRFQAKAIHQFFRLRRDN
jgi:hypothetical protein